MTDEVQKIRKEVERLRNLYQIKYQKLDTNDNMCLVECGKRNLCNELLLFIDSLQEEPVSTRDKLRALSDGKQHLGWLNDAREVEEESVNERRYIFDNCLNSEEKFILPQKISGNINCENCLYSSACALGDIQACIIDKPVSEDLEKVAELYMLNQDTYNSHVEYQIKGAFKAGAKWQKQQDQSAIELAEDHAMLAGMEKIKEEMMVKAIDAELYSDGMLTPIIKVNDKEKISDIKFGDEVKVIVIRKD